MKAKTEQFLYHLLFFAEQLSHPTYASAGRSFEAWAYRNGYLRRIQELERQAFIEQNRSVATGRIYRLTEKGRLRALGGRDPEARWSRDWDGKWRVLLFDLPRTESTARKKLHHVRTESQAERLLQWGKQERVSWRDLLKVDPLLPHELLPSGYLGMSVWTLRKKTLAQVGRLAAGWIA